MKFTISRIALVLAVVSVILMAFTVPGASRPLRDSMSRGEGAVVALTCALWALALGATAVASVEPVPKAAWGAVFIAALVIGAFLALLHGKSARSESLGCGPVGQMRSCTCDRARPTSSRVRCRQPQAQVSAADQPAGQVAQPVHRVKWMRADGSEHPVRQG